MVCVGESATLPDSGEPFTTVRDALPAFAVIITEEALLACHVNVTLCPLLIELLLAENVRVGEPEPPGFDMVPEPQPLMPARIRTAGKKSLKTRSAHDFIPCHLGPEFRN